MEIKNNIAVGAKTANELFATKLKANEKEEKLTIGQKLAEEEKDDAVALSLSSKATDASEFALENFNSAASTITDISKAEEMIRESNRRILDQASDAVLTQANQTVPVTSELLK